MHCSTFQHRLDALLDDRRDPAADHLLCAHAASCRHCEQILTEHVVLLSAASRLDRPAVAQDFSRRVVAAAVPAMPRSTTKLRWQTGPAIVAVLASAAAMLIAVSLVWLSRSNSGVGPNGVASSGVGVWIRGFGIATPPHTQPNQPRSTVPGMSIADVLLETPLLPQRFTAYRKRLDLAVALPAAAQRLDEIEQASPGLRSLHASLSVIWETLFMTMPTPAGDSPAGPREGIGTRLRAFQPARAC
jgi:hypothetical protein